MNRTCEQVRQCRLPSLTRLLADRRNPCLGALLLRTKLSEGGPNSPKAMSVCECTKQQAISQSVRNSLDACKPHSRRDLVKFEINPAKWGGTELFAVTIFTSLLYSSYIMANFSWLEPVTINGEITRTSEGHNRAGDLICNIEISSVRPVMGTIIYQKCPTALKPGTKVIFQAKLGRITGDYLPMHGSVKIAETNSN